MCAVRELAARLLGIVCMALSRDAAVALLDELLAPLQALEGNTARFEDMEGALSAAGYVLAQCLTGTVSDPHYRHNTWLACYKHLYLLARNKIISSTLLLLHLLNSSLLWNIHQACHWSQKRCFKR